MTFVDISCNEETNWFFCLLKDYFDSKSVHRAKSLNDLDTFSVIAVFLWS